MSVRLAIAAIILIWSTTPLAVKWSGEDVGFLFGVAARMVIAFTASALILALIRKRLSFRRVDWQAYFAIGVPLYAGMTSIYWGAQYIPSGLISVIFGFTPMITAVFALFILSENHFTLTRVIGMVMGVVGLTFIFKNSITLGEHAYFGVIGTLIAVVFHSLSTVWMKRISAHVSAFAANTGGLMVAVILFVATWFVFSGSWPVAVTGRTGVAIVYLAIASSLLGSVLFFYVLKRVDTGQIALLTLIAPVFALSIGMLVNHEKMQIHVIIGVAAVILGVLVYYLSDFYAMFMPKEQIEQTTLLTNGQSVRMSLIESGVSVASGYVLTIVVQLTVFPLFGIKIALGQAATIALVLVLIAFVKNYSVRRLFNLIETRARQVVNTGERI